MNLNESRWQLYLLSNYGFSVVFFFFFKQVLKMYEIFADVVSSQNMEVSKCTPLIFTSLKNTCSCPNLVLITFSRSSNVISRVLIHNEIVCWSTITTLLRKFLFFYFVKLVFWKKQCNMLMKQYILNYNMKFSCSLFCICQECTCRKFDKISS